MPHFWTKNTRNVVPTLFLSKKIGLHFSKDSNLVRRFLKKEVPMGNLQPAEIQAGSISHFPKNSFHFGVKS